MAIHCLRAAVTMFISCVNYLVLSISIIKHVKEYKHNTISKENMTRCYQPTNNAIVIIFKIICYFKKLSALGV